MFKDYPSISLLYVVLGMSLFPLEIMLMKISDSELVFEKEISTFTYIHTLHTYMCTHANTYIHIYTYSLSRPSLEFL